MGRNHLAGVACVVMVALPACEKQFTGSALPLNMQPAPPQFVGGYDFELLDSVRGKACVHRGHAPGGVEHHFWVSGGNLDKLARDPLTEGAIGAAAFEAISGLEQADTMVVTRVVTESGSADEVCAYVFGRAIRLTKAGTAPSSTPAEPPPASARPHHDDALMKRDDDLMKPMPF